MTSGFAKADCERPGGPVVLITGSSGVVGGAVAAMAESTGWVVRGVDIVSGPRTQLVGDLRDSRHCTPPMLGRCLTRSSGLSTSI